jgi:hypothetical protein
LQEQSNVADSIVWRFSFPYQGENRTMQTISNGRMETALGVKTRVKPEREPEKDETSCPTDGCLGKVENRGVCSRCYATALKYVRKGRTTWRRLEELGIVMPAAMPNGRGRLGPMSLTIEKALRTVPQDEEPASL